MPDFLRFCRRICVGTRTLLALTACLLGSAIVSAVPVPLIIDTDTATDCDDAGALAVAHALQNRGECVILAVVVNNKDPYSVGGVDAVNTWYDRGDIPLGAYKGSMVGKTGSYQAIAENTALYKHDVVTSAQVPDALTTYRAVLAAQPDASVVIASIGWLNNLEDLLKSPADAIIPLTGAQLVAAKVKSISIMGGRYPSGSEYNFTSFGSPPSTKYVLENWPATIPIMFQGYELGENVSTGPSLLNTPAENPVRKAYETIYNGINGRHSWDQCAVLHAVRGLSGYWTAVTVGSNTINSDGSNAWVASPDQNQAYSVASMPKPQLATIIADLMNDPPLPSPAVKVIFDTDYSTDCDDPGALAVLHALADNGEAEILATGLSTSRPKAPGAVDVVNTYYGRSSLPIGATKIGPSYNSNFTDYLYDNFPHDTPLTPSVEDAVITYRRVLAAQPDDSVVFITVGYLTNMAELLKSPADAISPLTGMQLVAAKVKEWTCMGGNFWTNSTDNVNFSRDHASAQYAIVNFPNKLTFLPREVASVPSPLRAGEELNETPLTNPVRIAYHKYFGNTTNIDRHCADLATVMYAVRGRRDYWDLHTTGSMTTVNADGTFTWDEAIDKNHNYLVMKGGYGVYSNETYVEGVLRNLLKQTPGEVVGQWQRFETELVNTQTYPDPYKDVTLNVTYTSPSGSIINFWGYHDGGQKWKLRFMPHESGIWQYTAAFSDGQAGKSGIFNCVASERPVTIGAYSANTRWFGHRDGEPFMVRSFHAAGLFKFSIDDPANPGDGEKRTAFLDWAQAQGYNTLSAHFFSTRDASDSVGPKLWPLNHEHYQKVEMILDDLSDREIVAYAFTGFFGNSGPYPASAADRTLYIRYCLARFAPYWNIIMNVGGFEVRDYLSDATIRSLGAEIAAANPFGHLLGAHQRDGDDIFRNDAWCSYATLQHEITSLSSLNTYLLNNYVTGKPVYAQETLWMGNNLQPNWTLTDLRKQVWIHMMSAAAYNAGDMNGNNESGFGGSLDLSERIQARHDVPKMIWDFMQSIPFHTMTPRQDLRNSGFMLADGGKTYLCYLPAGGSVNVSVAAAGAPYNVKWINARNPLGDQRASGTTTDGQGLVAPDTDDWLLYLTASGGGGDPPELAIALYHFDEVPGNIDPGNPIVNHGSAGPALNLTNTGGPDGRDNTGGGGYGAAALPDYGTAFNVLASGNHIFHTTTASNGGGLLTAAAMPQSALQGADGAFTYEALVSVTGTSGEQTILAHDGVDTRGFLFRIHNGTLSFYTGVSSYTAPIPSTGIHQFAANAWFHVAVTYNGQAGAAGNLKFYWTAMDAQVDSANPIGTATLTADLDGAASNLFGVGTTTRNQFRFELAGLIDEVRLHDKEIAAGEFAAFVDPLSDTSGDGILDSWAEANGYDPALHIAQDDDDFDGIRNLMEFALNLDPWASDTDGLPSVEPEGGYLTMMVSRNPEAAHLLFVPEVSSGFMPWQSGEEYVTIIEDTPSVLIARDKQPIASSSRRFMRLRVSAPAE